MKNKYEVKKLKKIIPLILLVVSIVLTGCGKYGEKGICGKG